ncbi:MAG: serine/threonine protein kinase, partial [Dolichospermum sp.]
VTATATVVGAVAMAVAATAGVAVFTLAVVVGGIAMSVAVPALAVKAIVGDKLEKSFSKFHAFLILAGTCNVGLGLGWIVYKLLTV